MDPTELNIVQPTIIELGKSFWLVMWVFFGNFTIFYFFFIIVKESQTKFYIAMEGKILLNNTSCHDFMEALRIVFCLYFIFNLMYPKDLSLTLEMIQRYYVKHHPDYGTKSSKKSSSKKKVIAFINKLAKIQL